MATLTKRLAYKAESGENLVLHFETSASIVLMKDGTNVQDRLDNIADVINDTVTPLKELANENKAAIAALNADVNTAGSIAYQLNAVKTPLAMAIDKLNGDDEGSVNKKITDATTPLKSALETLNGDKTVVGSVAKTVEDRAKPIEDQLANLLGTGEGGGGSIDDRITNATDPLKAALDTLNGDVNTAGSIDKKIAEAVANLVGDSPEAFDQLVEFYNWIQTHEQDATTLRNAITKLNGSASTTGSVSNTVNTALSPVKTDVTKLQSDLTAALARITALETTHATYTLQTV